MHVDFLVGKVAIEVDGYVHLAADVKSRDEAKETRLTKRGYAVMRISNEDAMDARALSAFINEVRRVASMVNAGGNGRLSSQPMATPAMAKLATDLANREKELAERAKRADDDASLFKRWIESMPPRRDRK